MTHTTNRPDFFTPFKERSTMKTLTRTLIVGLAAGSVFAASSAVAAPLAVTNGDFETNAGVSVGGGDGNQNIDGWFDSTANFSSWHIGNATSVSANMSNTGWIYQSLGTYDAADGTTLNWSVDVASTNPGNTDPFEIAFYSGAFAGADGTDLSVGSLTLLDSGSLAINGSGGYDNYDGSFSLAGVTPGDEVWVRIQGGGFNGVDNVSVSQVPEPGSLALLGLGGLCLTRRRRRA